MKLYKVMFVIMGCLTYTHLLQAAGESVPVTEKSAQEKKQEEAIELAESFFSNVVQECKQKLVQEHPKVLEAFAVNLPGFFSRRDKEGVQLAKKLEENEGLSLPDAQGSAEKVMGGLFESVEQTVHKITNEAEFNEALNECTNKVIEEWIKNQTNQK